MGQNFSGEDDLYFRVYDGSQYSNEARVIIRPRGPKSTVSFDTATQMVNEDQGLVFATFNLSPPPITQLKIPLQFSGTAAYGVDYLAPENSSVTVPAGQTQFKIPITILDDTFFENSVPEYFSIGLTASALIDLGTISSQTISIIDNELIPTISLGFLPTSIAEDGAPIARLVASMDRVSDVAITLPLSFSGTATPGLDYIVNENSVTFLPGLRRVEIPVKILDDPQPEFVESIKASLRSPSPAGSAWLGNSISYLSIQQSDFIVANFVSASNDIDEGSGNVNIALSLSAPLNEEVRIPLKVVKEIIPGASANRVTFSSNSFVFAPNETTALIQMSVADDEIPQQLQNIFLSLGVPNSPFVTSGKQASRNLRIVDNDMPTLSFQLVQDVVGEAIGTKQIVATLSKPVNVPTYVPVIVSGISDIGRLATPGTDFTLGFPSAGGRNELVFGTNEFLAYFYLTINDDSVPEGTESIRFGVGPSSFGLPVDISANPSLTVLIEDNDPLVSISLIPTADITLGTNEVVEKDVTVYFRVSLTTRDQNGQEIPTVANQDVVAFIDYSASTATPGSDYTTGPTSVTIPRGEQWASIPVIIHADTVRESNKTVNLRVTSLTNGLFKADGTGRSAKLTIIDDEGLPTVTLGTPSPNRLAETNQTLPITVSLNPISNRDVFVTVALTGSARLDKDYVTHGLENGVLKIPANSRSASFSLRSLDDPYTTGDETIRISMVNVVNAKLPANPSSVAITLVDDELPPSSGVTGSLAIGTQSPQYDPTLPLPPGVHQGTVSQTPVSTSPNSTPSGGLSVGLVTQSQIFLDSNLNGFRDYLELGEPDGIQQSYEPDELQVQTQADGTFTLYFPEEYDFDKDGFIGTNEGRLVALGGTDTSTGIPVALRLMSPMGSAAITPLTTLAEFLVRDHGLSVDDAYLKLNVAFNIAGYEISRSQGLYEILSNDILAAKAYVAAVQVYNTALLVSELFVGTSNADRTIDQVGDTAFKVIASQIWNSDIAVDLTFEGTIESIIGSIGAVSGLFLDTQMATGAAQIVAAANQSIQQLSLIDSASAREYLTALIRSKKIAQGEMASAMRDVGAGSLAIASAVSMFTGASLDSKISNATIGVIAPPAISVSDAVVKEGNGGQVYLTFTVAIVGPHEYPVAVGYQTADETADASSGDYRSSSGTVTWAAGDIEPKTIQIIVYGDHLPETDESMRLLLHTPSELVIRRAVGVGVITNDDTIPIVLGNNNELEPNTLYVAMGRGETAIHENGLAKFVGPTSDPTQFHVLGLDDVADNLFLDFSEDTYRADTLTFVGGNGSAPDTFTAVAGVFGFIEYSLLGSSNSRIRFVPEEVANRSSVLLNQVETVDLNPSQVGTLIIRVPASVTSIIVENADAGRIRVRSATNAFAPIEFNHPSTQVRVLTESASTLVTLNPQLDLGGATILQGRTGVTLDNSVINENRAAGSTIGSLRSLEFGFDLLTASLATGGTNNGLVQLAGGSSLQTSVVLDYETIQSLSILVDVTSPLTGETIQQPLTVQVQNLAELSAPIQIGDGTAQRSLIRQLVVSIDSLVDIDSNAFLVELRTKDSEGDLVLTPVNTTFSTAYPSGGGTVVTIAFSGALTNGYGALADGNYQLTINGSAILLSSNNLALDGNNDGVAGGNYQIGSHEADLFFALFGDANGSKTVDSSDLLSANYALRKRTGQDGFNDAFDFNADGIIDSSELLRTRLSLRNKRTAF